MRGLAAAVLFAILVTSAPLPEMVAEARGRDPSSSCQRRRRRAPPRITAAQRRQIRRWHTRATRHEVDVWMRGSPPALVFRPLSGPHRFELTPTTDEGGFDDDDLALASQALAYRDDGSTHPIHPRLVELTYAAVRHFRAPYVHVISGYRSGRPSSRHAQGRALDFVLPGVSDRRLAAWLRTLGFVGVGIYPTSGFVHLDVRARSYFWSDSSGPDQRNRERPMLRSLGPRSDRAARARGVEPTLDLVEAPETESETEEEVSAPIEAIELDGDASIGDGGMLDGSAPDAAMLDAGVR